MGGSHDGLITYVISKTRFNSIHAKGGTSTSPSKKLFKNGGARALNLGGSTGFNFSDH